MVGNLIWGEGVDDTKEIISEEELENTIDRLTKVAEIHNPFSVALRMNSKTAIQIIVGLEISTIEFYSADDNPQYSSSLGHWDDEEEWISFSHRGDYSEVPKKYFVPINDAREAFRQYFRTGLRPKNIEWDIDIT